MPVVATLVFLGLIVAATVASTGTDEPESAFTETGGGASPLVEDARGLGVEAHRLLSGPTALSSDSALEPPRTLLVIIAPERPYDTQEADAARAFLENGGRILVVDNYGQANTITSKLGITFERVRVVEPEQNPVQARVAKRTFALHPSAATAIWADPNFPFDEIANTSARSFLDRDGDGVISAGDPPGPFALGYELRVGANGGVLFAFSDPSVFLSDSAPIPSHRLFREALLAHLLPEGGRIIVDESRAGQADPWLASTAAVVGATTSDPWRWIAACLVVGTLTLAYFASARDLWGPHRASVNYFVRREGLQDIVREKALEHHGAIQHGVAVRWNGRGLAAIFGGLAAAVLGLVFGSPQATYLAAFLLSAAALSMTVPAPRLHARRVVSADRVEEESTLSIKVDVSAHGVRRANVEVLDELPREFEVTEGHNWFQIPVARHIATSVSYHVKAGLRGAYHIGPMRLRTTDVFRLRTFETRPGAVNEVRVSPSGEPLGRIPFRSRIPMMTLGPHLVNRAGEGTEFHALRSYQNGDSIRIVNWKASARSKELVVNQRVHESMATITIFLDARSVSAAGVARLSPLNEGCRAALSVASGAIKARDKVRIFVYGDGVRELTGGPGRHESHQIADALADIDAGGVTRFKDALCDVLPTLQPKSPFILISGLEDDPTVADGMLELRQRGLVPVTIAMAIGTEPRDAVDGPPEDQAQYLQTMHTRAVEELHGAGISVVPAIAGIPLPLRLRMGVS